MTSAARPTWFPARGGFSLRDTNSAPLMHLHAKELACHSKMKYRYLTLLQFNQRHTSSKDSIKSMKTALEKADQATRDKSPLLLIEAARTLPEIAVIEQDADDTSDSDSRSDEEEENDDTNSLLKELEKIKKERKAAQDKVNEALEAKVQEEINANAMMGNPLLNGVTRDAGVKRKWDDDVVFKNQGGMGTGVVGKRFINDLIRSDFHRKFMGKYMK